MAKMDKNQSEHPKSFTYHREKNSSVSQGVQWSDKTPDNGVSASRARSMEQLFLDRTLENLKNSSTIYSPLDRQKHAVAFDSKAYFTYGDKSQIRDIMEDYEIYDKKILRKVPENTRFEYTLFDKGLFSKSPAIKVTGLFLVHMECMVTSGYSVAKVPLEELDRQREKYHGDSKVFTYIAVLSPTGFEPDCYSAMPDGANFEIVLIEPVGGTSFRITSREDTLRTDVLALYSLESIEEKRYRVKKFLGDSDELGIPGGFIVLSDAAEKLGLPLKTVREVFEEASADDDKLGIEIVQEKEIIKRARI